MTKTKSTLLISIVFCAGLAFGGWSLHLLEPKKSSVLTRATEINFKEKPESTQHLEYVPQIVANQLKTGELNCPKTDSVVYEACLLYQGALGIWQRVGFSEVCPVLLGGKPETSSYIPRVNRQISYEDALRAPSVPCFSYLYAIQVANATPILVSTATRVFKMASGKAYSRPGSNPALCIEMRNGICGNHTAAALALFEKAGFEARALEFYYEVNGVRLNHIMTEVLIDKQWRPVDTTYGAYWIDDIPGQPIQLSSLENLIEKHGHITPTVLMHNAAMLPHAFYSKYTINDPFIYLSKDSDIIRGSAGIVRLSLRGGKGQETFVARPNYIGDRVSDGAHRGVSLRFVDASPAHHKLTVRVSGHAADKEHATSLCVNADCKQLAKDKKEYKFEVDSPQRMYVKSQSDVAYIVLKSIKWSTLDGTDS